MKRLCVVLAIGFTSGTVVAQTCEALEGAIDQELKAFSVESAPATTVGMEQVRLARAANSLQLIELNVRLMEAHKCPPLKEPIGPVYLGAAVRCQIMANSAVPALRSSPQAKDACDKRKWAKGYSTNPAAPVPID